MLIVHVFQCLECKMCLVTGDWCLLFPSFAAELWTVKLIGKGERMGCGCAQDFPTVSTQIPSLCVLVKILRAASLWWCGEQSIPQWMRAAGFTQLVVRGSVLCSCSIRKCQSCFGLRIAISVGKEEWGIANMKAPETCLYHTLVRDLRSFAVWPAENWKTCVQHPFVPSVVLQISFGSTRGTSRQLWASLWNLVTPVCAVTLCKLSVKSCPEKNCCAKYWRSV